MALISSIRFRPYSHQARTVSLIPGSTLMAEVYPAKLLLYDLASATPKKVSEHTFTEFGPLQNFCVQSDLERGCIVVTGQGQKGFMRYYIAGSELLFRAPHALQLNRERLFLGIDKSQEWPQVLRRGDINEILPFWYWLSQSIHYPPYKLSSAPSLLMEAKSGDLNALKNLFQAGFTDMLVPRLVDLDYHGFTLPVAGKSDESPLLLLKESFPIIRSLFFQEEGSNWHILPNLQHVCGNLSRVSTKKGHKVAIEWSKRSIRRLSIEAACDDEIRLFFQKPTRQYRQGSARFANGSTLALASGLCYILDHFEK